MEDYGENYDLESDDKTVQTIAEIMMNMNYENEDVDFGRKTIGIDISLDEIIDLVLRARKEMKEEQEIDSQVDDILEELKDMGFEQLAVVGLGDHQTLSYATVGSEGSDDLMKFIGHIDSLKHRINASSYEVKEIEEDGNGN